MSRIDDIINAGDPAQTRAQIEDFMRQVRAQLIAAEAEGNDVKVEALIGQYDVLDARLQALPAPKAAGVSGAENS